MAWGAVFWSQGYSDWQEIGPPMLTVTEANPSQLLDYYRFSSDSFVAYQQLQLDLLRHLVAGQLVTTNFMGNFPDLDYHDLARSLDFVTWDSYPTGYAELQAQSLYAPGETRPAYAYDVGDPAVTGFCHDLTRGLKPDTPFWVMEQQCGQINWSLYNTGVRSSAVRLWTWHALTSGASAVVYFRWRATLYAQEQYHSGLLHHDASPAPGYHDLLAMLPERELMAQVAAEPHTAEVALLLSYDDLWAIQLQPHHRDFGYLRHLFRFYRALQGLGVAVDIISPDANLAGYKIVLAPTAHLGSDTLAAGLTTFAANGGTVLLGVRSGFKTASNRVTNLPLPGPYQEAIGATVVEWQSLPPQVQVPIESSIDGLVGPAGTWLEWLQPAAGTEVLATYGSGPFAGGSALSQRHLGRGQIYYLGWYPGLAQCRALMQLLTRQAGVESLAHLPEGVLFARRGRYTLLLNFSDEARVVEIHGETIHVPAREVRVRS
jgi:beta-galactosidase